MPGKVNMQKGIIEVLACVPGGKLHESILEINIIPYYLQVSLLLIGLQSAESKEYKDDNRPFKGDEVEIWVKWEENNQQKLIRAEELVWNSAKAVPMEKTNWIFTGSKIENGVFMADRIKSLITTYNDQFTIIDNPLIEGNNDEIFRANEKIVPAKWTAIELIIIAL